jgi:hypothetical protein
MKNGICLMCGNPMGISKNIAFGKPCHKKCELVFRKEILAHDTKKSGEEILLKEIDKWLTLIHESYQQDYHGDPKRDNKCYEAMRGIGCPLYASNYDYNSMKEAIGCVLNHLKDVLEEASR